MQNLLRITVLALFAAAGVALAVPVAMHSVPASPIDSPKAPQAAPPDVVESQPEPVPATVTQQQRQQAQQQAAADAALSLMPAALEWSSSYQPLVARQLGFLQDAIETLQADQQQTAGAISQLQDELPEPEDAPPPPPRASNDQPGLPTVSLDQAGERVTINLENSEIRGVLRTLGEAGGFNILTSPNVTGTISASISTADVESALQAILKSTGFGLRREGDFVYVGTTEDLQRMAAANETVGTRVYRPDYVAALELQKLITPMLSASVGTVTISSASEVGIASDSSNAGGDAFAGSEVVLVRDYHTVLAEVDQIVAEVDRMPAQVAIEAMILSVKLDDSHELGVDFELLRQKDTIRIVSGTPLTSLATANFSEGLKVGFLDGSLFAFLDALETIGDTNVIAAPRVLCLNKQRAEILIGAELGYVSTTITETAATQTVEFLEVGTHLRIRPFVSEDGMIRLEVHPELSQGTVRVEEGFTLPDKEVTQVTTNVMCRSHATVVIGGLIREDLVTTSSHIPLLGNLPLVGPVFRQRKEETIRREIIVLLTPRIVDELQTAHEGTKQSEQFHDRRDVFFDKMSPLGKRQYGERYTRLARAAWAAQDADAALRYANLALHYDPLHQGAVNLRQEILSVYPQLELGVRQQLKTGLAPWGHPHHDYSVEGWPWRSVPEVHITDEWEAEE